MRTAILLSLSLSSAVALAQEPAPPLVAAPAASTHGAKPTVPRMRKQPIGACGCSLYAPEGFSVGAPDKSEDGADVYTGTGKVDDFEFGVIAVKFPTDLGDDGDALEGMLVGYMTFLRGQLNITQAAGVGLGHRMESHPAARGVIDYWTDKDGVEYAVKGWVDGKHLGVLYIAGKGSYPLFNVQSMYLDGFRFE